MSDPYGVSIAAGYAAAAFATAAAGERRGLSRSDLLLWSAAAIAAGGIIGRLSAMLGGLIMFPEGPLPRLGFPAGGVSYYPALAAGLATVGALARRRGLPLFVISDLAAAPVALGLTIGLIGWQPPGGFAAAPGGLPVVGGVAALVSGPVLLIALEYSIFWLLWRRREDHDRDGQPTFEFLALDAAARFASVWVGGSGSASWLVGPLTVGQWQNLAVFALVLAVRPRLPRRAGRSSKDPLSGPPTTAQAIGLCTGIIAGVVAFRIVAALR